LVANQVIAFIKAFGAFNILIKPFFLLLF